VGAGALAWERIVRRQAYRRLTMYITNAMMASTTKTTIKIPIGGIYPRRRGVSGIRGEPLPARLDYDLPCGGAASVVGQTGTATDSSAGSTFLWVGYRSRAALVRPPVRGDPQNVPPWASRRGRPSGSSMTWCMASAHQLADTLTCSRGWLRRWPGGRCPCCPVACQ
jgi:hypothetical protein